MEWIETYLLNEPVKKVTEPRIEKYWYPQPQIRRMGKRKNILNFIEESEKKNPIELWIIADADRLS